MSDIQPSALGGAETIERGVDVTTQTLPVGMTVLPEPAPLPTADEPIDFFGPRPELPKKFHPQKPSDVRFFAEGTYFITQANAGLPDGVSSTGITNDGYGNYSWSATGPTTGWSYGEFSLGLSFQHWENIPDMDRPDKIIYRGGFPLTLRADFGQINQTKYTQTVTASTAQLQNMGYTLGGDIEQALTDAYISGNYGDIFGIDDAFKAMLAGYDPSTDFDTYTTEELADVPYARLTLMPWIVSKDKFNTAKVVNFGETVHFGIGPSLYWYGNDSFLGGRGEVEFSAVRTSYGPVRADLMVNAAAGLYWGYEPSYFGTSDFWNDGQFMVDGSFGTAIMFTTNLPKTHNPDRKAANDAIDRIMGSEEIEKALSDETFAAVVSGDAAEAAPPDESLTAKERKAKKKLERKEHARERRERFSERVANFDVDVDTDDAEF